MDREQVLTALTKCKNGRIRQWAEKTNELEEYLAGKTPLGFLAWLRWLAFFIPFKAAISDDVSVSWWQALIMSIGIFIGLSIIDPFYRRYKISSLVRRIQRIEKAIGFTEELRTEVTLLQIRTS